MDDPRAEPQYGERVPYVVRAGAPGARLIDRVVSPEEMLKDKYLQKYSSANNKGTCVLTPSITSPRHSSLHSSEYLTWSVPMFVTGTRTCQKYLDETRKNFSISAILTVARHLVHYIRSWDPVFARFVNLKRRMMVRYSDNFFLPIELCQSCLTNPSESVYALSSRSQNSETHYSQLQEICSNCCGVPVGEEVGCDSRDCPVFYSRLKAVSRMQNTLTRDPGLLEAIEEWAAEEEQI